MATFLIMVPVTKVQGYQVWEVKAANETKALEKWNDGHGQFVHEEIEVIDHGTPEVTRSN